MQKRLRDDQINEENAIIANFLRSDIKLYNIVNIAKIIDSQEEFNFINNTTNDSDELKLLKSVYKYLNELFTSFNLTMGSNFDDSYDFDDSYNELDEYTREHITHICIIFNKDINLFEAIIGKYIDKLLKRIEFSIKINYNMKISLYFDFEINKDEDVGYFYIFLNTYEKRN